MNVLMEEKEQNFRLMTIPDRAEAYNVFLHFGDMCKSFSGICDIY